MIEELKIDRYINFLNRKLEKLYTPLSNIGAELLLVLRETLTGELDYKAYYEDLKKLDKRLENIRCYTHLASDKLKKDLEAFLLRFSHFIVNFEFKSFSDEMQEELIGLISKLDKILSITDEEIKDYRNELTQLMEIRTNTFSKFYWVRNILEV